MIRPFAVRSSAGCCVALAALVTLGASELSAASTAPFREGQDRAQVWLGPDLSPLPFSEDEILEALRTGTILEREWVDIGINGIDRLLIEKDGVRLRAGFRVVDVRQREARVGGELYLLFRDDYRSEYAAYQLARLLGISNVPPTTLRTIRGDEGSIQLWVEDLFEDGNQARSPDSLGWALQHSTMLFFDALIYNVDRNPGNLKVDHSYKLWMIDHTRAFQDRSTPFQLERVNNVPHRIWQRFRGLSDEDFEGALTGPLEPAQVAFFMERRGALIEHIEKLIAERGPGAVLLGQPAAAIAARPSPARHR